MKLIFIRHGDPDYVNDSLTEKGFTEAKLLAKRIENIKVDYIYTSVLGRAKDTASFSLDKKKMKAVECNWLREFEGRCIRPDVNRETICWDFMPEDWTSEPLFYDKDRWLDSKYFENTNIRKEYEYVTTSFDKLLSEHGYVREGGLYRVKCPNDDTLVFFCHYGVTCVILGHLMGISPMLLWHGMVAAPSSVTTLTSEERREGAAIFRMSSYGDISHLYVANEEPAFAARFCEMYSNENERH